MIFTIGTSPTTGSFSPDPDKIYNITIKKPDNGASSEFDPSKIINFNFIVRSDLTNSSFIFRLYIQLSKETPNGINFPTNVVWDENTPPVFKLLEALYMLEFEWVPTLKKWLGKQICNPVLNSEEAIEAAQNQNVTVPNEKNPLTFTATENNCTVAINIKKNTSIYFQSSKDIK